MDQVQPQNGMQFLGETPSPQPPIRSGLRSIAILLVLGLPVAAQSPGGPPMIPLDPSLPSAGMSSGFPGMHGSADSSLGGDDFAREQRRVHQLNLMRHKEMTDDAARLLRTARELQTALAAGQPAMSQAERMRRVAEIEKLARSVQEKMLFSAGAAPDPFGTLPHWR